MNNIPLSALCLSKKITHLIGNYIHDDNSKTEALSVLLHAAVNIFIIDNFSRAEALDIFIFSFDSISKLLNEGISNDSNS
jgi:hypothetical protein